MSVPTIGLLWLATAIALALIYWPKLDDAFASPDNAMRLTEVRAFLDGAPWFDPHEPRLWPPAGYDTHWSRLIDAGVAGFIALFRQMVAPDLAERLALCIWPLLLSGPTVFAIVASAVRLGGPGAGQATLLGALLALLAIPGIFVPGEIDHHNAQVMLASVIVACVLWCQDAPRLAAAAGLAGGLLLGVGLEAVPVLVSVAAGLGLLAIYDVRWHKPVRAFGLALGGSTTLAYLALTPSAFRVAPACDALAVNSASAVLVGSIGLAVVASLGGAWPRSMRWIAMVLVGALALGVFAVIEPRCLRGPFGLADQRIIPLWLDSVREVQSIATVVTSLREGVVHLGFPLIVIASVILVVKRGLSTPLAWMPIAALAIVTAMAAGQIRMSTYITWLGMPFVGTAVDMIAERTSRPSLVRFSAAALTSQPVVSIAIIVAISALAGPATRPAAAKGAPLWMLDVSKCLRSEAYRPVAMLPPGLIFAPVELGPSLLAFTPHSVIGAGYHRADKAIVFTETLMRGEASAAREPLIERGVRYVMTCTDFPRYPQAGAFYNALLDNAVGPWLEPVPMPPGEVLKVWRIRG